jgi:hypothetical protein
MITKTASRGTALLSLALQGSFNRSLLTRSWTSQVFDFFALLSLAHPPGDSELEFPFTSEALILIVEHYFCRGSTETQFDTIGSC